MFGLYSIFYILNYFNIFYYLKVLFHLPKCDEFSWLCSIQKIDGNPIEKNRDIYYNFISMNDSKVWNDLFGV